MHAKHPAIRMLLFALLCATACGRTAAPIASQQVASVAPTAARLDVQADPAGALVIVDGEPRGRSPLTLSLAPGEHQVTLNAEGFAPLTETISLEPGREAVYSPSLADNAAPVVTLTVNPSQMAGAGEIEVHAAATDNVSVAELELLLDGEQLANAEGGELTLTLTSDEMQGAALGHQRTLTARATDSAGNVGETSLVIETGQPPMEGMAQATTPSPAPQQATGTPEPSATPTVPPTPIPTAAQGPTAVPSPAPATTLKVTEISIPTYPYASYLSSAKDPQLGDYPVLVLDRVTYDASNPKPAPKKHRLLVLENQYLRLGILPELGGRIYECTFKPTGNNECYSNPVIKPTHWGPASPPYVEGANWWLAAGGIEWGFPVEEHGYEWATKWGYDHVTFPDGSMMVSLFTPGPTRPYAVVDITLPPDAAYFSVQPRITNAWGSPFRFQWWANAMLAPGAANAPGPELHFVLPGKEMTVHSTNDPTLPGAGQPFSWPVYSGRDLSRLGNWTGYLGFFERPAASGDFMAVYDTAADEGMVRVYPSDVARGAKVFAPGWSDPVDWHEWTDDASGYVELHGGLTPTFADWYELPPGGEITWTETWYPVAGIGGLTHADATGAIGLVPAGDRLRVGVFLTRAVQGQLTVSLPGMEPVLRQIEVRPDRPVVVEIPYAGTVPDRGRVIVTLADVQGRTVLSYQGQVALR